MTYHAAQRHVDRLVRAGVLREVTGRARDRLYFADEILRAIDEPLDVDRDATEEPSTPEPATP